ncbi:hypothetical protein LX32DRAFT_163185 [Colletotrichum zoysiae]|uniref:Uncharacterized protein n=1 Tax=Colletotrichum zoysiae TaxID=1216348 RepID=A0AAD9H624_9PEZI|nr:hypothetical protein LX32DRAFT_163185 [Colletotrichum zoysiae]
MCCECGIAAEKWRMTEWVDNTQCRLAVGMRTATPPGGDPPGTEGKSPDSWVLGGSGSLWGSSSLPSRYTSYLGDASTGPSLVTLFSFSPRLGHLCLDTWGLCSFSFSLPFRLLEMP